MFILASLTAEPCVFKTEAKESLKLKAGFEARNAD